MSELIKAPLTRREFLTLPMNLRRNILERQVKELVESGTDLLTISEAAGVLKIHANTLRRWSDEGRIRAFRIGDRHDRRYRRSDINKCLKRVEVQHAQI